MAFVFSHKDEFGNDIYVDNVTGAQSTVPSSTPAPDPEVASAPAPSTSTSSSSLAVPINMTATSPSGETTERTILNYGNDPLGNPIYIEPGTAEQPIYQLTASPSGTPAPVASGAPSPDPNVSTSTGTTSTGTTSTGTTSTGSSPMGNAASGSGSASGGYGSRGGYSSSGSYGSSRGGYSSGGSYGGYGSSGPRFPSGFGSGEPTIPRYANGTTHPFFGGAPLKPGGFWNDGYSSRPSLPYPYGGQRAVNLNRAPMYSGESWRTDGPQYYSGSTPIAQYNAQQSAPSSEAESMARDITARTYAGMNDDDGPSW